MENIYNSRNYLSLLDKFAFNQNIIPSTIVEII